jgi:hypothetical protein
VVALQPKLSKKRAEEEHRWTLGRAELDRIAADIWPKAKSDRMKSAQGVSARRPPLTCDARHALDEASADLWKVSHDELKEPEILRRRRVGKGVWYAVVDVIMWDDDHVGRSLGRFHERCEGKQAPVAAARNLLGQHAKEFAENITVEAEVLQWQERLRGLEAD